MNQPRENRPGHKATLYRMVMRDHDGVETTPQAFIEGERIGGYDDLLEFFGTSVPDPDAIS
jgi:glutaredoxin-related protein